MKEAEQKRIKLSYLPWYSELIKNKNIKIAALTNLNYEDRLRINLLEKLFIGLILLLLPELNYMLKAKDLIKISKDKKVKEIRRNLNSIEIDEGCDGSMFSLLLNMEERGSLQYRLYSIKILKKLVIG